MNQHNFGKAVVAGLVGTLAMTIVMLMAPVVGMPPMPIGNMLSGFMHIPVALGWIMHFMIGTVLATRLPGKPVVRGLIYSLIPWLMAQVIVNPLNGISYNEIYTDENEQLPTKLSDGHAQEEVSQPLS